MARRDRQGVLRDIETVAPEIVSIDDSTKLFYRYKTDRPGSAMLVEDAVEVVGGDYRFQRWNPETLEYVEDEAEGDR